jgi:DHA1 family bicyclomycin/chloramphenicol resistance-like MFS transporter
VSVLEEGLKKKAGLSKGAILTGLIMATVAAMMSTHLYTPSMPHLADYFQTTPAVVKLTLSLNALVFALMQLVYGPASDRFGRRPVMLVGMVGFSLASLACSLSQSISQLIVIRIVQGIFSAAEAVLVYAVIHDLFKETDRVRALAIYGMTIALAPATAPIVGGYIHVWLGWRANFLLIALFAGFTSLIIWRVLPETSTPDRSAIKLARIVQDYLNLLTNRHFMNYAIMTGGGSGTIMAMVTAGPFILITNLNVPTQYYGLFMTAPVLAYMLSNIVTRKIAGRYAVNVILRTGLIIAAVGVVSLGALVFSGNISAIGLTLVFAMTTFGMGPVFAIAPMKAIDTTDRSTGVASAMVNTIPMVMGAMSAVSLSVFHDGTARPLAGTVLGLLVIAAVSYTIASRRPIQ